MKIKFITLNIWHGYFLENAIDFLKKENADILALQEVYFGTNKDWDKKFRTFEILQNELGYPYASTAPHVIDNRPFGKVEQGNAIFSKFPILDEKVTFYNAPFGERKEEGETDWSNWPCNLQEVVIQAEHKKIHIFNTHGPWKLDGSDNKSRLEMSELIVKEIQDKELTILAGDFNVRPNTQTIQNIEKYLQNVFKDQLVTTFNMQQKTNPGYATAVVDMVFVSHNISVINAICPQVEVSDHLPLICEFEI